ncbi:MAG: rhodanese-like domain-containing protein [Acidobacteria bacterium]|nr:rhodanese-like domain-containing protein [Acidobacteriota bacterium]
MPSISREELLRALGRENLTLVEVLPREYYERAHLPGAVSIPADEIASLAPSLLPDKQASIVTYGLNFTWQAAQQATRELITMGYASVREYEEGKQDWIAAGLPLEGENLIEPLPKEGPSRFLTHLTGAQRSILQQPPTKV